MPEETLRATEVQDAAAAGAATGDRRRGGPRPHDPATTGLGRSALIIADASGHIVLANRRCARLLRSRRSDLIGTGLGAALGNLSVARRMIPRDGLRHPGGTLRCRWYNRHVGRWFEARVRSGGGLVLVAIRAAGQPAPSVAASELVEPAAVATGLTTGVLVFDRDLRCVWRNAAADQWLSHRDGTTTDGLTNILSRFPKSKLVLHARRALDGDVVPIGDVRFDNRDGRPRWAAVTLSPARCADGRVIGVTLELHEVTERRRSEAVARRRARRDTLTGLTNRGHFMRRLRRVIGRGRRHGDDHFGVLFVDLDEFKRVNDAWGHDTGDRVLACIGRRLRAVVRPGDTVARLGGDEFAVLLDSVADGTTAHEVARRAAEAIAKPIIIGAREITVGASVGVTTGAARYPTAEAVLAAADRAMYRAKASRARSPARRDGAGGLHPTPGR